MKKSVLKTIISVFLMNIAFFMAISSGHAFSQDGGTDAGPIFIANPNPLYWNDTYIASQSQQTLSFFNAGDTDLVITSGVFDGPFETYNSFPITVPAGTPYNQVIHFKPFELGLIEGSVTYTSNDPANPSLEVSLIGTCIDDPINGWEWMYTGFLCINMDIEFPEGQDQIGYIAGQYSTMYGLGIVLKTTDGGDTWNQITDDGIHGLTNLSFPTLQTGYAVGWDNSMLKTTDGGDTWQETVVDANISWIHAVDFKDENNGVIVGIKGSFAFAYSTTDGGANWVEGTGNEAAEDVCYAGENTYYSAGYEEVCKSADGGLTWTTIYTQGALLTAVDFYDEDYGMAAGDYGQVITTWDGGDTWEEDIIMDWLFHNPFIWDRDTAYVVGTPEYVYKTTDAGQNWESDFDGNWMKAFYQITFTDNYTGFIAGSGGIVCRKKPGTTGEPMISATPNPLAFDETNVGETAEETLTIENTGDATLNVTDITSTNAVFSVDMTSFSVEPGASQDVTVSFDPVATGYVSADLQIENNSANNPYEVMVSGTGTSSGPAPIFIANPNPLYFDDTYIASNSQQTLSFFNAGDADLVITQAIFDGPFETYNSFPITVPAGTPYNQVIHFKPFELGTITGKVTYISNDPANPSLEVGLIGDCIDDPINGWEWIYTGYNYILTDIEFPEGQDQIGYTVGQSVTYNGLGIVLKTTDGGDNWTPMTEYGIAGIERCSFPTLETGYAVGWTDDIMKTTDGGQTWENIELINNVYYYSSVEFKDENNGIVLVKPSSTPYTAYYTSDGGTTWTEGTGCSAFEDVTWAGGDTWYASGYEYVSKSTDNGATWTDVYTQGALLLGSDFLTPEFGIACGDYGQVITTKDGGATWTEDIVMDWLFHKPFIWDNDTAYVVGTPEYIYKTTDAGENWISDFDGNWQKALYAVTFTDNYTGYVCGGSNGIVLRKKPGVVIEPIISATPNPLEFDNTYIGDTAEETLTVENTGDATLEVTDITSTNAVFSVDMTSFSVEPGESQDIAVYFDPVAAGYVSADLQIENNSAVNPYEVMVSGTGLTTGPAPVFIANPNPLYWNDTYIASQSQQTLVFFNAGDADLVITQASFDGPFETYNSFPITVAPGATHNQVIHFKPLELGLIEGSVTYTSNDPINPSLEVSLIGRCIDDPINGWEWIWTGYNYILTDLDFPEGQHMIGYTVGQSVTYNGLGIILKTTDGGDNWVPMTEYGIDGIERCSFPSLNVGYAVGWNDDIMKTTDGGETWETLSPVASSVFYYSSVEFKDDNNGILIAKMNSGPIKTLYTSDGGSSWHEGTGNDAFEDVTWAGGDTWYTTGYSNVCKSTDNGTNWTTVFNQGALLLGADFLTPDYGIAAGDYGQVVTTWDGGQTWETDIIMDILFHKPFIWDTDTAYVVGTPEYVYKTTDAGQNWVSDFDGNWMKALYNVQFTDNYTGFICGGSNGIILRKKPGVNPDLDPPTNLQAVVNNNDVTLTWDAPASDALMGYNLYRDNSKVNGSIIYETFYYDEDVFAGNHLYQVSAVYDEGESPRTEYVEVFIEGGVTGKIHGFVRDAATNLAIDEAFITASNMDNGTITYNTPFGAHYSLMLPPGTYDLTCEAVGYQTKTESNLPVVANVNKGYTFYLTPMDDNQEVITGIDDGLKSDIKVYPNPARNVINVNGLDLIKVVIMNYNGQVVYQNENPQAINVIQTGSLPTGLYMMKVETTTGMQVEKIVIEK